MVVGSYNFSLNLHFEVDEKAGSKFEQFGQRTTFMVVFTLVRKLI